MHFHLSFISATDLFIRNLAMCQIVLNFCIKVQQLPYRYIFEYICSFLLQEHIISDFSGGSTMCSPNSYLFFWTVICRTDTSFLGQHSCSTTEKLTISRSPSSPSPLPPTNNSELDLGGCFRRQCQVYSFFGVLFSNIVFRVFHFDFYPTHLQYYILSVQLATTKLQKMCLNKSFQILDPMIS